MIISLFMEKTPLCRVGRSGCGAHACTEPDGRWSGSQARDQREQQ
jgi:hypothetical protein